MPHAPSAGSPGSGASTTTTTTHGHGHASSAIGPMGGDFTRALRRNHAHARRNVRARASCVMAHARAGVNRGYAHAPRGMEEVRVVGLGTSARGGTLGRRGVGRRVASSRGRGRGAMAAAPGGDMDDGDVDWSEEMQMGDDDGEFVVEAFDSEAELAQALCLEVEENARGCLEERGAFTLAIPGGSVAKALSGLVSAQGIDWGKVHVFFVNERPEEAKCLKLAKETWTTKCGIPDANVHAVMATGDLALAAADYEKQMRSLSETQLPIDDENGLPVFDLILLGMGADGHVGSIYPNSATANDETGAAVLAVDMPGKKSVTMSMPLINTADRVVLAATGEKKAETVRAALEDELEWGQLPGAMVDAFSTIWFLDLPAASKLQAYEDMDMDSDGDD